MKGKCVTKHFVFRKLADRKKPAAGHTHSSPPLLFMEHECTVLERRSEVKPVHKQDVTEHPPTLLISLTRVFAF